MARSEEPHRSSYIRHILDCDMTAVKTALESVSSAAKSKKDSDSILQLLSEITSEYARRESTSK